MIKCPYTNKVTAISSHTGIPRRYWMPSPHNLTCIPCRYWMPTAIAPIQAYHVLDATANSLYRHTMSLLDAITYIISPALHVATGCHRHSPHTSIPCRYWMPPPIALILAYHVATGCHHLYNLTSIPCRYWMPPAIAPIQAFHVLDATANSSYTGIPCRYWMSSPI